MWSWRARTVKRPLGKWFSPRQSLSPAQVWYRSHCWRRILSAELSQRIGRRWLVHALGTGFFVSDGAFVITARHVITQGQAQLDQVAADRKRIVVGLAIQNSENMRGNFRQVGFDVVGEDEANDLTLIRLQQNPFAGEVSSGIQIGGEMVALPVGVGRLVTRRPVDGEAVAVSGYP
ncbi:MAG: hypothetical protein DMD75_06745 [Candidatus Rokuibacteriota bacterium]|nr:MAG: hypothetical protein DMD75_06745 [Candidatus Rokubacteria bacterium]